MKKIVAVFCCGCFLQSLSAQITIQPGLPAAGMMQKNQLWNVLVLNNSNSYYNARLDLVLTDRATGQEMMTASTGFFEIGNGSKQLNADLLSPIQYNYLSSAMDNRIQGLLPAGAYTACYALHAKGLNELDLAEECVSFDVEPLSPPLLIFPADSSLLNENPAQFSWIPPTPAGMFNYLKYEILITQVNEGQNANEAIEENIPFYTAANQLTTSFNFPGISGSFEKNKWYAWQVIAKDDKSYAAKSEVWVFKVNNESVITLKNADYLLLAEANTAQGVNYLSEAILNVKYYSYDKAHVATININTINGKNVFSRQQKMVYGENYFTIKLNAQIKKGEVFIIEYTNPAGNKSKTLFSIINNTR